MATQFAFPASPTVGQIASLPDGNQAQWNGYAWVEVGGSGITTYFADTAPPNPKYGDRWIRPASATEVVWVPNANNAGVWLDLVDAGAPVYPLAVSLGGTGATTASAARVNLGLDAVTGERIIPVDGTVVKPAIAFLSEPGLGWYRNVAGYVGFAVGGQTVVTHNASTTAQTTLGVFPQVAGSGQLYLSGQPLSSPNRNNLILSQASSGAAVIQTAISGAATRGNLTLDAPATSVLTSAGEARFSTNGDFYAGGDVYPSGVAGTKKFPALVATNAAFPFIQFSSDNWRLQYTAANGTLSYVSFSNAVILNIDGVGNFTISGATATKASGTTWANPSSRSIKHDIEDYAPGLDAILKVRPRSYRLNDSPDTLCYGIVADEMEPAMPQSISYDANGMPLFQADPVIWALVNAVKTLNAKIEALI